MWNMKRPHLLALFLSFVFWHPPDCFLILACMKPWVRSKGGYCAWISQTEFHVQMGADFGGYNIMVFLSGSGMEISRF